VGQLLCRQEAQLLIDDRQKLIGRLHIAALDRIEYPRNFVHDSFSSDDAGIVSQTRPAFKG
jgi:hypothetical protein